MNNILSEKEYQKFILEILNKQNGYKIRKNVKYDRLFAMDKEMLFEFLNSTQPNEMAALTKIYKDVTEETIVNYINAEITNPKKGLIYVLKHGIEITNYHIDLMYTKPATSFNAELIKKYEKNIFSAMEEVWISDKERIDDESLDSWN